MAYFEIFSLGVWKRSTCSCSTGSSREDRHRFLSLFHFLHSLSIGGPANLCDSAATECLPAAECGALQQPSPNPTLLARSLAASLRIPTDWLPSSSLPTGLQAKSSSFRTGPPVLNLLLLLRQSVLSNLQLHSLCLFPARITLARGGGV